MEQEPIKKSKIKKGKNHTHFGLLDVMDFTLLKEQNYLPSHLIKRYSKVNG